MFETFLEGLIVHLVVDWFLQSDWMAESKTNFLHPAAWIHSGFYTLGMLLVFDPVIAVGLGISHLLIDLRKPMVWLRRMLRQNPSQPTAPVFEIWQDQAAHLILLCIGVLAT